MSQEWYYSVDGDRQVGIGPDVDESEGPEPPRERVAEGEIDAALFQQPLERRPDGIGSLLFGPVDGEAGERLGGDVEVLDQQPSSASGMSDRDIAATLVVSIRTVESHLAACYRKLDITSRQGLRDVLGRGAARPLSRSAAR